MTEGAGWLRRAGRGRDPGGLLVVWSVAEGRRGRRWRWATTGPDGAIRSAATLERDRDGGFARLELATAPGMLTFHPAGDGATAHGNVVREDRVDPIEIAWPPGASIAIDGDAFGSALGRGTSAGEGWSITPELGLRTGVATALDLDDRGVPRLEHAMEWALEE